MSYNVQLELPDAGTPLRYARKMSHAEFTDFCRANPEMVIEREADGTLNIMSPVPLVSGRRESEIITDLNLYARRTGGSAFSSSTGFTLPNGSVKSPGASYLSAEKLAAFSEEDLRHFAAVVPDFIVEVVSPSDDLAEVADKVRTVWIAAGVRLAWLIDVDTDRLWVYRADHSVELISPLDRVVGGEGVLPGFEFDLTLLH